MSDFGVSNLLLAAATFAGAYAVVKLLLALALRGDVRRFREICESVFNDPEATEEDRQVIAYYIRDALDWKLAYAFPIFLIFSPLILLVSVFASFGERESVRTVNQARRLLTDHEQEDLAAIGVDVSRSQVWATRLDEIRSLSTSVFMSRAPMTIIAGVIAMTAMLPFALIALLLSGSALLTQRTLMAATRYLGAPAAKTMIEAQLRIRSHHYRARGQ